MAEIVLGLGTSHSPQMSTPPEKWAENGDRFRRAGLKLYSVPEGEEKTFEELIKLQPASLQAELTEEKFRSRYDECKANLKWLGEVINEVDPDVLIIFGDDQKELFLEEQMPTFGVYWGDTYPIIRGEDRLSSMSDYSWPEPREFPGYPALAEHIIRSLVDMEFDLSQASRVQAGKSISHPFAYVMRSILDGKPYPVIPVWMNTYFAPNQPTAKRCVDFGRAIRKAVEAWPGSERVAVMASGGLSHFVVDEELDMMILNAMKEGKFESLYDIPRKRMQAGTSESTLWYAVGGAAEHLTMDDLRYVPGYRTPAGTGCGMGFATWR